MVWPNTGGDTIHRTNIVTSIINSRRIQAIDRNIITIYSN